MERIQSQPLPTSWQGQGWAHLSSSTVHYTFTSHLLRTLCAQLCPRNCRVDPRDRKQLPWPQQGCPASWMSRWTFKAASNHMHAPDPQAQALEGQHTCTVWNGECRGSEMTSPVGVLRRGEAIAPFEYSRGRKILDEKQKRTTTFHQS